ncbi:hypothetical protein [Cupriavidus pauculus]|uniref:hypothetical protein n=1 Tax=Cupriavidus pauculus TaxID=82633 RepID=UPI001EE1E776|nr:hypothetical protein [Cupriavidus pauculus]GJG96833.1 hypothetical protein CBA19C6_20110 [Cupriavidus pauculus]
MAPEVKKSRMSRYASVAYWRAKKKFSLVLTSTSLTLGGITLLFNSLGIGHLPDFTWNDLFGTLLAVCATGVLVVAALVLYCLCAGFAARWALELVYPDAALAPEDSNTGDDKTAYRRLVRGPFVLGATCLSVLGWTAAIISLSDTSLISPYNERLWTSLTLALATVTALVLIDWHRFAVKGCRNALLGLLAGSITTTILIIAAWANGPDTLVIHSSNHVDNQPQVDWTPYLLRALDQSLAIGIIAVAIALGLIYLKHVVATVTWSATLLLRLIPRQIRARVVCIFKPALHLVAGDRADATFIGAKILVTMAFFVSSGVVFIVVHTMASMGSRQDWYRNFFIVSSFLIFLNCASFSVREWKDRAMIGLVTAALILLSYPLLARNPLMFPKMIVSMLGLGNERFATLALSSQQCAALVPYGVPCLAKSSQPITLVDVNMLSRLGNSMILELLIEDRPDPADGAKGIRTKDDARWTIDNEITLIAIRHMGRKSAAAKTCDPLLLDQLESSDPVQADALRCIQLIVPKDQVLGYTKSQARTYKGNYSGYIRAAIAPQVPAIDESEVRLDRATHKK